MTLLLISALALPAAVAAQVPSAPPTWAPKIKPGKPVFVTTISGERIDGSAGHVTADSIAIATASGIRAVPLRDVARVEKRDSVRNGILIGAGLGLTAALALRFDKDRCPNRDQECIDSANPVLVGMPLTWGLLGWGIDAMIKRRVTVFDASRSRVALRIGVGTLGVRIAF